MEKEIEKRGARLFAISVDTVEESAALVAKLGLGFPLLSDPGMKTIIAYGVAMDGEDIAVPSTFVIDRNRRIRFAYVGETQADRPSNDALLGWLDALE